MDTTYYEKRSIYGATPYQLKPNIELMKRFDVGALSVAKFELTEVSRVLMGAAHRTIDNPRLCTELCRISVVRLS